MAAALLLVSGRKSAVAPSAFTGNYQIRVAGFFSGAGHAAVGAKSVNIQADIEDESGRSGKLHAPNLNLDNNRFCGTGTFAGMSVTIAGRIEPADRQGQPIRVARLLCSLRAADSHCARVVGTRQGGSEEPTPHDHD